MSSFSNFSFSAISKEQARLLQDLPPDMRDIMKAKMEKSGELQKEIEEFEIGKIPTLIERPNEIRCDDCIFGYNFFRFSPTTFAPVEETPIRDDYILGPGDRIESEYFGANDDENDAYISRNGSFVLPLVGPVNLAGLTLKEARKYVENKVKSKILGTDVHITLKELRSIQLFIVGEAYKPGSYTISSLSSVSNLLFMSGGVNQNGSLRNIQIKRGGKVVKIFDFYDLLLKGDTSSDIHLEQGDTIYIPFIENSVRMNGAFKRAARFEFKPGETLKDAVLLAGGYKTEVTDKPRLELSRINRSENVREVFYVKDTNDLNNSILEDGDSVSVSEIAGLKAETINLSGEVKYPGVYTISSGDTLLDIINRAGGYTREAFSQGAIFTREEVAMQQKEAFIRSADNLEKSLTDAITSGVMQDGMTNLEPVYLLINKLRQQRPIGRQVVDASILKLKTDPFVNFEVRGKDTFFVPKRPNSVNVVGEILNSSTHKYDPDLSLMDYVSLSGGLAKTADKNRIFVVLPNGQAIPAEQKFLRKGRDIVPGSTIVVSRSTRTLDGIAIAQIGAPIFANLATSIAAIAAISNN
jgi:protein involved in polysaccharide export with SLBB domain